jgi:hypothetical protein
MQHQGRAAQDITPLAFKKGASLTAGNDKTRFKAFSLILKAIDDRLDKLPHDQWPTASAHLGDQPCEFLTQLLTDGDLAAIKEYTKLCQCAEVDIWQACNLLAMQTRYIGLFAAGAARDERINPRNLTARRALVAANEQLSIFAHACLGSAPAELAQALRRYAKEHGEANLDDLHLNVMENRQFLLGKVKVDLIPYGRMQQALDDANDFIVDLRTEAEHGHITTNRHILKLREENIDPADYLEKLKRRHPKAFRNGTRLRGKDLGDFRNRILDDLANYRTMIDATAMQLALRGIDTGADRFSTAGVDHDPTAKPNISSDTTWTGRLYLTARTAIREH